MTMRGGNGAPRNENGKDGTMTDIGEDLEFKKITPRKVGGTWVAGSLNGHAFEALVFPEHAEYEDYELGTSKISKLWLRRNADRKTVANFDRGWDIKPTDDAASDIVDFLCAGLADAIFCE